MEYFTPVSALLGGGLIGLGAVWLMTFNGRIAGISGMLSGALFNTGEERVWRVCFLLGLLLGAGLIHVLGGADFNPRQDYPWGLLLLGGILVGYGTRLGNGCTSGHGVCGLARGSGRSLAATLTFMLTAMLTVYVLRHLIGVAS